MLVKQGYNLDVSDKAIERITELGFDIQNGARPLRRAIQKYITDVLSKMLIGEMFENNATICIDVLPNGDFSFASNKNQSTEIIIA
jgi:ATP-dependent Clp protease ATP-binding subunit ClpA